MPEEPSAKRRPGAQQKGFVFLDAAALVLPALVHLLISLTDLPMKLVKHYEAQTGISGPQSYTRVAPWGTWIAGGVVAAVLLVCALRLWRTRRTLWLAAVPVLASFWWFFVIRSRFMFG